MIFKPGFVDANTLDEAYFMLLSKCWYYGIRYKITEGSMKGDYRLELPVAAGIIQFPHTRPLAPNMPQGVPSTTTDEKIEQYFVNYLMDPNLSPNEEYRYATWINGKMTNVYAIQVESQLEWCIRHLKEKGYGNNHPFITIGNPDTNFGYDKPYKNETERRTSPCLRGIDIKVKENKVILGIIYRSWDLFSGFPENMGGFTLLNEYIANELGVEPGPLSFYSQGLHCYGFQIDIVKEYLKKE